MKGIQSPLRGEGVDFRVEVGGSESEGSMRLKLTVNDAKPRETRDKGSSRRAGILVFGRVALDHLNNRVGLGARAIFVFKSVRDRDRLLPDPRPT